MKDEKVTIEENDETSTPLLDLVKNQKPHEFSTGINDRLGDLARAGINDIKSAETNDADIGDFE